ncbi:MAG: glycosyltransferase [Coriobacteriia bacterium]|nr:glycosyltransferase [Coriobacteriia bacterium]
MQISGKKICIVVYGIVDGRSIKTARALSCAGAYVKIISYTYSRKSYAGESFQVEYHNPAAAVPSKIKLRPFRILENFTIKRIQTLVLQKKNGLFGTSKVAEDLTNESLDCICAVNANVLEGCAIAAKNLAIPFVYEAYEYWPDHSKDRAYRLTSAERLFLRQSERKFAKDAKVFITVSHYLASQYQTALGLVKEPAVIFNAPFTFAKHPTAVHSPLKIVCLGYFQAQRNLKNIFDAVAALKGVELVFQGEGALEKWFKDEINVRGLHDKISVLPMVPQDEVSDSIADYDVGIFCPQIYNEQMQGALPNKFFEYISAGLIPAMTKTKVFSSFPEFDSFGVFIDPESADTIRRDLLLLKDEGSLSQKKLNAYSAAKKYCGPLHIQSIANLYENVFDEENL